MTYLFGDGQRVYDVTLPPYGARGDGVTDNTAAIQQAVSDAPSGSIIYFPRAAAHYLMSGSITCGSKALTFVGDGWESSLGATFGSAGPVAATKGSVLRWTGANDGIRITGYRPIIIKDVALLGPSAGTSMGVRVVTLSDNAYSILDNVLLYLWGTGLELDSANGTHITRLKVSGCTTAVRHTGASTNDIHYDNFGISGCGLAFDFKQTSSCSLYQGVIQGNTRGVFVKPHSTGIVVENLVIQDVWFEINPSGSVEFDTSIGAISSVKIDACRFGIGVGEDGSNVIKFSGDGSFVLSRLDIGRACRAPAVTFTVPGWVENSKVWAGYFGRVVGQSLSVDVDPEIEARFDRSVTSVLANTVVASYAIPDNAVSRFTVNVEARRGAHAASFQNLICTYNRSGGGAPVVLIRRGTADGDDYTDPDFALCTSHTDSESHDYYMQLTTSGNLFVILAGNSVAQAVTWRFRVKHEVLDL